MGGLVGKIDSSDVLLIKNLNGGYGLDGNFGW